MKLGIVTYNIAKDWDIDTIIEKCAANGFEGVELRTTHAHGVEVDLSSSERAEVKKRFEDSPIEVAGLGSAFEYHSTDPDVVKENIEGTKEYAILAADVGAPGIKVRPNGLPNEVPVEKTLEQIGLSLRECGEFAEDYGVQVRLEVHGAGTYHVPYIRKIMDVADHENVFVCWNSDQREVDENGSIKKSFDLVKDFIQLIHMRDLYDKEYPWRELLKSLDAIGYEGFCLAEVSESPDPDRVMKFYSALWHAYLEL